MTSNAGNPAGGIDPTAIRVGDTERNAALSALGEHMTSGRLDINEYGTRSAQVTNARTTGELGAIFSDLPAPHPALPTTMVPLASAPLSAPATSNEVADRSKGQRLGAAIAGASGIIAVILFFLLTPIWSQAWLVFMIVPASYGIANAVWGPGWRGDNHDQDRDRDRKKRDR